MLPPPKTDKPCLAGSVAIVAVFVPLMAFPSFTPTKRDNQSSVMDRPADSAIEAKRHMGPLTHSADFAGKCCSRPALQWGDASIKGGAVMMGFLAGDEL